MLHVWLRAQHSPLAVWHEDVQQWQMVDGWQQLQTIYGNYKSNSQKALCLYFPSSHALQVDTALNAAQLKQLGNSGKQYLFEETSLTPIEQLKIRQLSHADTTQLYALAQNDIESWQQSAQLAGMNIVALLPDFLLLPPPEEGAGQQVTLYQDSQTMLLRQSLRQGMAVSYLPLMFERFPHLSEVMVLPSIEAAIDASLDSLDSSSPMDFIAQTKALIADHQLLLTTLPKVPKPIDSPERHALNFFMKSTDSQLSPYLRVAMMVALSALVLQMATDGVQWYKYNEATAATKTAIAAQYQSWFADEPLSTRTKLQVQLQPKLRSDSQAPASHMAALSRISPLIKQSSLHAQSLVMQPSALSFTLIAPDRGSLDKFTSILVAQGLNAKLAQVNSNEQGQFSGQVTVNVIENNFADNSDMANNAAAS
ncbi:type II secretion system protein GspL [Psychrobacter sp. APC 3281]|uniref:type II secretion system protein GspL n=1 Tax=Psychrobacter sp. APC 3281 TaxID=3035190 RepID=UPI0025B6054C|nr:type II secretion system protein GspL [Psychrobacter sp. APC 3281]MDN3446941.1 type II secretion system protein GspL [Psychrobacter sp. APC 3281]